jgi:hypothetical protein
MCKRVSFAALFAQTKRSHLDFGQPISRYQAAETRFISTAHVDRIHHPLGVWGQVLGRGLAPRLSIGTLQLSIRCSSIHFFPSRSFPVSTAGPCKGWVVAFGIGGSPVGALSWADAGSAK